MSQPYGSFDDKFLDVLKELGNIGAGNAATSLSEMLNKRIDMSVPLAKIIDFNDLESMIGFEEALAAAVYLEFNGDINGTMMFLLDQDSAKNLIISLMGFAGEVTEDTYFNEIEISALQEIGNILGGAYLGAVARFTNLNMEITVPSFAFDMVGAILSVPLTEFGCIADKVLFIEANFLNGLDSINGNFIVIPNIESYSIILKSLGVD